jgi:hypothetical protein
MNTTTLQFLLLRAPLFTLGLVMFVLSFFHGPDLNLGTFIGISMLAVSVSPYATSKTGSMIWGISISICCFALYLFFLKTITQNQLIDADASFANVVIFFCYLLPLACLAYLVIHFAKKLKKR